MVDVDSYIKKLKPKGQRSSLKPFEEAIMKLRENDASLQQVVDFLAENGTTTTVGNVSKFIKKVSEKAAEQPAKPKAEKQNPPAAGGGKGSDEKGPGQATAEAPSAGQTDSASDNQSDGTEELIRPPGISNGEWSKRKAEHKAKLRSNQC